MDKINGDRKEFLELLGEVSEIARVQGRPLTMEELKSYFKDIDLSEDKLQAILQYFEEKKQEEARSEEEEQPVATIESADEMPSLPGETARKSVKRATPARKSSSGTGKRKSTARDAAYLTMYKRELKSIPSLDESQEIELLEKLLTGEEKARQTYIESKLQMVLELAEKYQERNKLRGVPIEEVIQEANLALMSAAIELPTAASRWRQSGEGMGTAQADSYLEQEIRHAIELHIDSETNKRDLESAVVAKSNLIHEAVKYLAEDFGRTPTLGELAEFTKIPEQEIADIQELTRQGERYASN